MHDRRIRANKFSLWEWESDSRGTRQGDMQATETTDHFVPLHVEHVATVAQMIGRRDGESRRHE